jgi:hypothetical protein
MNAKLLMACALGALVLLTGCPAPVVDCVNGDEPSCDAGGLPDDFCNSPAEALADQTHCGLTVNEGADASVRKTDVFISRLADGGVDKDWYVGTMPTLTPRSLLHVNAGYQVPQTAVNFSVNVLEQLPDGGTRSLITGADNHGTSAPKPVDLVIPYAKSNATVFVLVGDSMGMAVDNRDPYSVLMQVVDNPDVNEPNDTTPTPVTLTAAAGNELTGTQSGYLATNDDVDLYTFNLTAGGRQIIYLHLTGPMPYPTNPPPAFGRITFTLIDPMGTPIAEGTMNNAFQPIDLATARLSPMTGNYTVRIQGYKDPNSTAVVPGDLRIKYDLLVRVLPDLDTSEPNDTIGTAKAVSLSPNSSQQLKGKLSYVADEEWFAVSLSARPSPSVLRFTTRVSATAGRFAPTTGVPTRQVRLVQQVTTGINAQDRLNNCLTNAAVCPRSYTDPISLPGQLAQSVCKFLDPVTHLNVDPPECLYSERDEEPLFGDLKNFVGAIPIPANTATQVFVQFRDQGRGAAKYADDKDWTIDLQWNDDADEASRVGGPTVVNLGTSSSSSTGVLSYGYGRILEPFDINSGDGIRGPEDYDAVETDKDLFQFNFGGATGDQNWALSWDLLDLDGGSPPGDLALEVSFCGATGTAGALCTDQQNIIFGYSANVLAPWYSASTSLGSSTMLFTRTDDRTKTSITVRPVACQCFSASRVAAGKFFINVAAVNRTGNEPLNYTLRQSISTYPQSWTDGDAGGTCPVSDGGCGFGL